MKRQEYLQQLARVREQISGLQDAIKAAEDKIGLLMDCESMIERDMDEREEVVVGNILVQMRIKVPFEGDWFELETSLNAYPGSIFESDRGDVAYIFGGQLVIHPAD